VAVTDAVERFGTTATNRQVLVFTDSLVALAALSKGRASSPALLRGQRCVAAVLLSTGVIPTWRYVASELNAADRPSRTIIATGSTVTGSGASATACVDS
jgi:hypothetical protein